MSFLNMIRSLLFWYLHIFIKKVFFSYSNFGWTEIWLNRENHKKLSSILDHSALIVFMNRTSLFFWDTKELGCGKVDKAFLVGKNKTDSIRRQSPPYLSSTTWIFIKGHSKTTLTIFSLIWPPTYLRLTFLLNRLIK